MKVRCIKTGGNRHITLGKIYEVQSIGCTTCTYEIGYEITNDIGVIMVYKEDKFEIVKENEEMKELTFREVITNIKEGEIWERIGDNNRKITMVDKDITIENTDKYEYYAMCENEFTKYRLVRQECSFQEAFEAFESGEEIESVESKWRYKRDTDENIWLLSPHGGGTPEVSYCRIFAVDEIKGKWYINK